MARPSLPSPHHGRNRPTPDGVDSGSLAARCMGCCGSGDAAGVRQRGRRGQQWRRQWRCRRVVLQREDAVGGVPQLLAVREARPEEFLAVSGGCQDAPCGRVRRPWHRHERRPRSRAAGARELARPPCGSWLYDAGGVLARIRDQRGGMRSACGPRRAMSGLANAGRVPTVAHRAPSDHVLEFSPCLVARHRHHAPRGARAAVRDGGLQGHRRTLLARPLGRWLSTLRRYRVAASRALGPSRDPVRRDRPALRRRARGGPHAHRQGTPLEAHMLGQLLGQP
mmetsp:Transcript_114489/g.323722  ORF Transcript_114489/g.323722 Transcript_114489/m.323722 type:complete len:281 (+) Transcript_114489:25-867(+)